MRSLLVPYLFILCSTFVFSSAASPTLVTNTDTSQEWYPSGPPLASLPHLASLKPAFTDGLPLQKRSIRLTNFGNGWVGYVTSQSSFLPVQAASAALASFYTSVYNELQSIPNDRPPLNHFSVTLDNLA